MDEDDFIRDNFPCSSLAVHSIIRLGTAGVIWGLCLGPYNAHKQGITGITRASFVVKSAASSGLQCALVAGVYSSTRCGIQRYRRKKDMLNASIAGAITGAILAATTRRWTQVFSMATLVSAITTASEHVTAS